MDRHAAASDAASYWRQFPITVHFQEPCEVVGKVIHLGEVKSREEWLPRLKLQAKDGTVHVVLAAQTRLLAALAEQKPAIGDLLKITYHGEAKRAAPGLNPTKEFTVEVRRAGSPSGAGPKAPQGSAPDDAPRTGDTSS